MARRVHREQGRLEKLLDGIHAELRARGLVERLRTLSPTEVRALVREWEKRAERRLGVGGRA